MTKSARIKPRKSPRQTRSVATVDALVEAGARVLSQEGYERASVNRIAQIAGVSVGSLYQYFPSKEALVAAVVERHSQRMLEVFQKDIVELAHVPMPDAVRGIVARTFEAYALDPGLRRVILDEVPQLGAMARSTDFDAWLAIAIKGYLTFHADVVRPQNLDLAVRILTTAVEAVAQAVLVNEPEQLRSHCVEPR